jgi:predicted lipoprotein
MYQRRPKASNKSNAAAAAAAAVATDVAIVAADVAAKIAIPNGKSASFKSDGSPKPSKAAKR